MEFFSKYWPSLLGVLVVSFLAVRFLPEQEKEVAPERRGILRDSGAPVDPDAAEDARDEEERDLNLPSKDLAERPEGTTVMREKLIAVEPEQEEVQREFSMKDPEVQQALGEVEVVIYSNGDNQSSLARDYFSHNKITPVIRSLDDPTTQERARRLSGKSGQTVVLIDGQLLGSFSEAAAQAALTRAVKKRVSR